MRSYLSGVLLFLLILTIACGRTNSQRAPLQEPSHPATLSPATPSSPEKPKIVAFGDSLTAGYGLTRAESYPALLQDKLEADGYTYEVVNAGVSGDTSAGGLRRIDWALEGDVRYLIVELGANDILRGQSAREMKKNLAQIIERARARGVQVVLAGMYAPTSFGPEYQREVRDAFQSLAREYDVTFIPFFLDRVGGVSSMNQTDGIHPNAEGTRIVAETVYNALRPRLQNEAGQEGK
jgi:acyl-CoA thioesterase-1